MKMNSGFKGLRDKKLTDHTVQPNMIDYRQMQMKVMPKQTLTSSMSQSMNLRNKALQNEQQQFSILS